MLPLGDDKEDALLWSYLAIEGAAVHNDENSDSKPKETYFGLGNSSIMYGTVEEILMVAATRIEKNDNRPTSVCLSGASARTKEARSFFHFDNDEKRAMADIGRFATRLAVSLAFAWLVAIVFFIK